MASFDFVKYNEHLLDKLGSWLGHVDGVNLVDVMNRLIENVEYNLAQNLTPVDHEMMACAAGCGSCCMVNVDVLLPEVKNISRYLRDTRTPSELRQLKQQMQKMVYLISGLDEEERIALRKSCTFLDSAGSCSIYPVRPLMCRSITSIDAEDCRNALTMRALGENIPVTMNLFQKNIFEVAYQALAKTLDATGVDNRGYELTAAVLTHLEE